METRLILACALIAVLVLFAVLGAIAYRRDRKLKRKDRWR